MEVNISNILDNLYKEYQKITPERYLPDVVDFATCIAHGLIDRFLAEEQNKVEQEIQKNNDIHNLN